MKKMMLGTSDLEVTRLAYGCMGIGGNWEGSPLEADIARAACASLDAAVEAGINFFDHADIYARGKGEEAFGRWLADRPGMRDRIVVQSKCGIRFGDDPTPGLPARYDFSYGHITASVEGILRRLKTDRLDVLLLHRPDPLVEPQEVARAFDDLLQGGKVRHFGVSNHNAAQIELLRRHVTVPLVANQVEISLLHTQMIDAGIEWNVSGFAGQIVGDGTLEYCRREDITLQAWSPLARDSGRGDAQTGRPASGADRAGQGGIEGTCRAKNAAPEAIALAWLMRHPAGIQPIIGTRRPDRIRAACQADAIELSREEWMTLYVAARGRRVP